MHANVTRQRSGLDEVESTSQPGKREGPPGEAADSRSAEAMSLIGQLRDYAACRHRPDGGASSRVGNGLDGLSVTCLRDELQCQQLDVFDPVAYHLSLALLPALARAGRPNQRFVDQLMLALSTHLDERFGALAIAPEGGGLSAWQLQRARELIASDLAHGLSVDRLARECALSRSHFTRAFKRSMGMSPQDWLQKMRIEKAKELMLNSTLSLSQISQQCGFSDQSHFSRVFLRLTGMSPTNWRRFPHPGKHA